MVKCFVYTFLCPGYVGFVTNPRFQYIANRLQMFIDNINIFLTTHANDTLLAGSVILSLIRYFYK